MPKDRPRELPAAVARQVPIPIHPDLLRIVFTPAGLEGPEFASDDLPLRSTTGSLFGSALSWIPQRRMGAFLAATTLIEVCPIEKRPSIARGILNLFARSLLREGELPFPVKDHALAGVVGLAAIAESDPLPVLEGLSWLAKDLELPDDCASPTTFLPTLIREVLVSDHVRDLAIDVLEGRHRDHEEEHWLASQLWNISEPEPLRMLADSAGIEYKPGEWRVRWIHPFERSGADYIAAKIILRLGSPELAYRLVHLKRRESDCQSCGEDLVPGWRGWLGKMLIELAQRSEDSESRELALAGAIAVCATPASDTHESLEAAAGILRMFGPSSPLAQLALRMANGVLSMPADRVLVLDALLAVIEPPAGPRREEDRAADEYVFRRVGLQWELRFEKERRLLQDMDGLRFMHEIMARDGRPVASMELYAWRTHGRRPTADIGHAMEAKLSPLSGRGAGPAAPARLDELAERMAAARRSLAEAERNNDFGSAEHARAEQFHIQDELQVLLNKEHQLERGTTHEMKVHAKVQTSISRAIEKLRALNLRAAAGHLRAFINAQGGLFFAYRPPGSAHPWNLV